MTHLVLVLYAGDYREARRRQLLGLPDRYRHHSYAVSTLVRLAERGVGVTVVQVRSETAYDERDAAGVRFLGLGQAEASSEAADSLAEIVRSCAATHVVLRFPSTVFLRRLAELPVRVGVVLADSFPRRWRTRSRTRDLAQLLAGEKVDLVANHHLNSTRQLVTELGLDPSRVVPWDWPLDLVDEAQTASRPRSTGTSVRLCYVGTISQAKGVWDLVEAVALLRTSNLDVSLQIAGAGQLEQLDELVRRHGLGAHIHHLGRLGGQEVIDLMKGSDFVCVPSRHAYPEGLPLTLYEAMASGTPVVASDHPMFTGVVRDRDTGFVFRAGRPRHLARVVRDAWSDVEAYAHVSARAAAAYPELGVPALWGELIVRWIRGAPQDVAWLRRSALASYDHHPG